MNKIRSAIVSMYVFFRPGRPVSRKVVASGLTSVFVYLLTIIVAKRGGHLDETQTDMIAVAAANIAGFCAGWLRNEFPQVVTDGQDLPQSSLSAPALPSDARAADSAVSSNASAENIAATLVVPGTPTSPPPPASH